MRTWKIHRFRGRISTQPGSIPLASFRVRADRLSRIGTQNANEGAEYGLSMGAARVGARARFSVPISDGGGHASPILRSNIGLALVTGPYGERDQPQMFLQTVSWEPSRVVVLDAATGKRYACLQQPRRCGQAKGELTGDWLHGSHAAGCAP